MAVASPSLWITAAWLLLILAELVQDIASGYQFKSTENDHCKVYLSLRVVFGRVDYRCSLIVFTG